MKSILKFSITGKNFRKIEEALKAGYVLTGKSFFSNNCVVLKLNPTSRDNLRITSFKDATYYMSGGYPRPSMVVSDNITVRVEADREAVIDNLIEKMKAGWFVQSLIIGKSAVLTKTSDEATLCTNIAQLADAVYSAPAGGAKA